MTEKNQSRFDKLPTVWKMWECPGGSRWTTCHSWCDETEGAECSFSGCGCGGKIRNTGATEDRDTASNWFRRPCRSDKNIITTWNNTLKKWETT